MKNIYKFIIIVFLVGGFYYLEKQFFQTSNIFTNLIFSDISNSRKNNQIFKEISLIMSNKNNSNLFTLLNNKKKSNKQTLYETTITTKNEVNSPIIYIYNTHDKETYSSKGLENYNISADVKTASYILQEQLKKYDIMSIVEERSPTTAASKDGLSYPYSYRYSKTYALENMEKYETLNYFIDLHRDGVKKDVSTVKIDNINYAKLMLVIGTEYEESSYNLELAKKIENYINKKYPGILRNTYINANDHYNQNIHPNCFLIEVGGNENTLDEVYNSLTIFAEALAYIVGDEI